MRFHLTIHFHAKDWETADRKFKRVMKVAHKVFGDAMGFLTLDTRPLPFAKVDHEHH